MRYITTPAAADLDLAEQLAALLQHRYPQRAIHSYRIYRTEDARGSAADNNKMFSYPKKSPSSEGRH